jgi:hypothetical protein
MITFYPRGSAEVPGGGIMIAMTAFHRLPMCGSVGGRKAVSLCLT